MANDTITRTNALKKLIQTKLKTLNSDVYFNRANDNALYPHIVFSFREVGLDDLSRQDYMLEVDIWDQGRSTTAIDTLADKVEDLFDCQNLPQSTILPTFFKVSRKEVMDQDKDIQHRLLRFQIQNYVK